jgi:hypothetical protein
MLQLLLRLQVQHYIRLPITTPSIVSVSLELLGELGCCSIGGSIDNNFKLNDITKITKNLFMITPKYIQSRFL